MNTNKRELISVHSCPFVVLFLQTMKIVGNWPPGALICAALALVSPMSGGAELPPHPLPILRTNLLIYEDRKSGLVQIHSVSAWKHRRQQILAAMQEIMGPFPGKEKRCSLDLQIRSETNCGPYT